MADHGEVQYSTAAGNDYPAHENTYEGFVHMSFAGSLFVIVVVLGLGISSLTDHWVIGVLVTFIIGPVGLIHALGTGTRGGSVASFVLALLAFALTTAG